MARQRCGPAAGRSIAAGGSGRVWVAALRHLDGAIRSTTPPRRRDTRLPEPCSWKTDAAIAPVASVAAFLIFTSRACGAAWRQALAGSTLRSSAWGRRGPVRSRGTVAEVCPRSGSIRSRSSTQPAERQASQRARAAGVAAVASERPCLQHSRRRRVSLPRTRSGLVGQLSVPVLGQPRSTSTRTPPTRRNVSQVASLSEPQDKWLPRQTPPT